MFRICTVTAATFISLLASPSVSQTAPLVYKETLEHPYSQGWYALYLENETGNTHRIYVRGEGKLGDFTGVLYLDCEQPKYSNWQAQSEYLSPADVPPQAINRIRKKFCK